LERALPDNSLNADYARAGFGGSLQPGRRLALLLVDMVQAYLDPASPLYAEADHVLGANIALIAAARRHRVPAIFTNVSYQPGGIDGGLFYRKVPALAAFTPGAPMGDFPQGLRPEPAEAVITKQYPSAFFGTPLASMLVAQGIDTLLITGFSTSGCVRASALDALCHGFVPLVIDGACGDRDPAVHTANLFDIGAKVGEVISVSEALALIDRQ
jgi:maleamate amidohydrolase